MSEPFDRVVVQVYVGDFAIGGKRIGVNRKPMILRGDFNPACGHILNRMIPAVMADGQFVGATAEGEA